MTKRTAWPRTACPVCCRDVAIDPRNATPGVRGTAARHNDDHGSICQGSFEPVDPDPLENIKGNNLNVTASGAFTTGPGMLDLRHQELADWWRTVNDLMIETVVPKAIEYGATDLRDLGVQVLEMSGREPLTWESDDLTRYATEIGIAFYALGKLGRIVSAIKEKRTPSYDTWLDLAIYATMALRVHAKGSWPAVADPIKVKKASFRLVLTEQELAEAKQQAAEMGWSEDTIRQAAEQVERGQKEHRREMGRK